MTTARSGFSIASSMARNCRAGVPRNWVSMATTEAAVSIRNELVSISPGVEVNMCTFATIFVAPLLATVLCSGIPGRTQHLPWQRLSEIHGILALMADQHAVHDHGLDSEAVRYQALAARRQIGYAA